ncbi:hypothetical protein IAG15_25840, partial [Enterococcus faecalis]|nr:hypothetical protein [Enterococcus faecalis]
RSLWPTGRKQRASFFVKESLMSFGGSFFSAAEWLFFSKEYLFMAAMVQTTTQALLALVDRVSSLRLVLFRAAKSC